ncbi:MAG TPA: ribbon-helix-helix domain-containing protein [Dehalococcoidia bacterium]|jgi:hypothetical protein|nr:ribbon-helix-helix domain-containing protein [Dehalococcoidia bacterium]
MTMIRKQVYITPEQEAALKDAAAELGMAEAELVRQGIDKLLANRPRGKRERQEAARKLIESMKKVAESSPARQRTLSDEVPWSRSDLYRDHPRRLDDAAWEEELEFIRHRMKSMPQGGSTTKVRREDSYDNRRLRLPD